MNLKNGRIKHLGLAIILLVTFGLKAQIKTQADWQQRVNHTIDAKLNPETNILSITQEITYWNNSPNELNFIYFHVWPEAFANKQTPFAKECIKNGVKDFVHATKSKLSKVSNVSFQQDRANLNYSAHETFGNEVLKVLLNNPLKSGEKTIIKNSINIYIPDVFSRFGTRNGFYSITQWYPKPAVYDANGWNVFPYKSIGEYYSEYGSFDVSITIPSDFVVAATGDLQTKSEREWLDKLAKGKNAPRPEDKDKTIVFYQDDVHDFAWFAAREMKVGKKPFYLNGDEYTAWAFVDKSKEFDRGVLDITNHVIAGVKYYSKRVGQYPYKHCSAVIGPLEGAGGMEYPMITICESADEGTIVHEVGHNWFQGMLGSNERVYPWMDESINTFYQNQQQATPTKYKRQEKFSLSQSNTLFPAVVLGAGAHQGTGLHSHEYSNTNYGVSIYINGPLQFMYLQEILGRKLFDSCMKAYFAEFKFRHPLPSDMQNTFERVSKKDLNWFFKEVIKGKPTNLSLGSSHKGKHGGYIYKIKNKTNIPVSYQYTLEGIKHTSHTTENRISLPAGAHNLVLNPNGYLLETNLHDNYRNVTKKDPLKKHKFGLRGITTRGLNSHWVLPNFISYNMNDGYTPGLFFSNIHLPRRGLEYNLAPSYGIRSGNFVGQGRLTKSILEPSKGIQRIQVGVAAARYSFYPIEIFSNEYNSNNLNVYNRIRPEVQLLFNRKNHWQSKLDLDFSYITYDKSTYEFTNVNTGIKTITPYGNDRQRNIFNARYSSEKMSKYNPIGFSIEASHDLGAFSRGIFNVYYSHIIPNASKKNINFRIQLFGMLNDIIDNTQYHTGIFLSAPGMASDAAFREVSQYRNQNRSANVNRFGNTYVTTTMPSIRFPMVIPVTGNYMAGVKAQTHFLPIIPIQLYFDGALATVSSSNKDQFWWTSGLTYSVFEDHRVSFEASLPLVYSKNIKSIFESNYNVDIGGGVIQDPWEWWQMFQFKLNLKFNRPDNLIRKAVTK